MNKQQTQDHPFVSLAFNILIPVLVLQRLSAKLGATNALILALVFPLGYGLYDYFKNHNKNWISVLGFINTLFTGGFALLKLSGIWFAVKEAAFPLLIGIAVLLSNLFNAPAMRKLFFNRTLFNLDLIDQKIAENSNSLALLKLFKKSTYLLATSFFLSATLNFLLAVSVFADLPLDVSEDQKTILLNDQIAQMTWLSFIVIVLPLMLFMGFIFWHLLKNLKKLTGLNTDQILIIK